MNQILEKKMFWVVIGLTIVLFFVNLFSDKLIEKAVEKHYEGIAEAVVKKLQKEYCPSPYGPGIDPDKIDINKFLPLSSVEAWEKTWGEQKHESE
jgi:hypothetical protein